MKKLLLFTVLLLPAFVLARTVTINTGAFSVQLNDYGRIRIFSSNGTRNMDRISLLAGISSSAVFDYYSDGGTRRPTDSTGSTLPQSLEIFGVFDNSYSGAAPAVAESVHIYTWSGKKFAICQFFVKNETGETHDFYVSLELVSQVGGTYENDTSEVLSNRLVSMYDGSANSAIGAIILYPLSMFSYRADPWGNHQYDDNYYWIMMTSSQVDNLVPGDQDGVYGVLNAGLYSTVPNDSTMYFAVGLLFGANKDEIQTVAEECLGYYEQYISISEQIDKVKLSSTLIRNNVISLNSEFDSGEFMVMDASGRILQFGQIRGKGLNNIHLERGLQEGVYFLIVKSREQSLVKKFVVVR